MRESIGGTWLTGIVVTFLALFAGFLTYAISYTKAFRVKDKIIQLIEENEGYNLATDITVLNSSEETLLENGTAEAEIFYMIKRLGYNYASIDSCPEGNIPGTEVYGYCVEKHCTNSLNADKVYYKVTTYIALKIPIVNIAVKIPITGETNTLFYDVTGMDKTVTDNHCYE